MANYTGRTTQQAEVNNFLGINAKSSIVAGQNGEAIDIDNWDIDLSGAITRRLGYATQYTFAGDIHHFDTFFKLDGTQVYVAVSAGSLYEATSPAGPWAKVHWTIEDVSGNPPAGWGLTTGDFTYVGTDLNGAYVLCNGVDKPVVFIPGEPLQPLEVASKVPAPTNLVVTPTNGSGNVYQYALTSATPRGESTPCLPVVTVNGPSALTITDYNTLSWTPQTGASIQYVYRYNSSANAFYRIATLTGTADSFVDNGAEDDIFSYPPSSSTSYNTPQDWEDNGEPEGVFVVARGKNQRMLAWRKNYYWLSALSNIYDWYSLNDSFSGYNLGGQSNNITAVATLYEYTVLFSTTNAFVYSGSSFSDWSLSKILNTGCPSPYGITSVADQVILWSQFGPTTVNRILAGQDVQTNGIAQKISPIVYGQTAVDQWGKVRAWHDLPRQRVCFAVPGMGETKNTIVLAYNYQTKGWTQFSAWEIENLAYDPLAQITYASLSNDKIVQLHNGNMDGGTRVDNSYSTIYYDLRTFNRKRGIFLDVMMDSTSSYDVSITVNGEFEDKTVPAQTYALSYDGSTATTNGQTIVMQGNKVNIHRLTIDGYYRYFQLVFEDTGSSTPAKILGWRPEIRVYGIR